MAGPLDGIRVIDLTTIYSGPICTSILGDQGADVVKVESPTGDWIRGTLNVQRNGVSGSFAMMNRNKRSIVIDLTKNAGKDVLNRLIESADIVVENFRPGTLEKWNLGPDRLHGVNPALVICRITGYGQTGPYKDRPGFARIAHAVSGLSHLAGMPDGPPVTPGSSSLADYFSGMNGALGILMALRVAEQTGKGQVIDVALYETIFRILDETTTAYAWNGTVRGREGRMTRQVAPHGHFECGDGKWVALACTSDRMWDRLARNVLGRDDLADSHPRTADRLADRAMIDQVVETYTKSLPMVEVVQQCTDGDVPCGPINSIEDIFNDPHFAARDTIETYDHPKLGPLKIPGTFPRLSKTPGQVNSLGPELGDWNDKLETLLADDSEIRHAPNKDN